MHASRSSWGTPGAPGVRGTASTEPDGSVPGSGVRRPRRVWRLLLCVLPVIATALLLGAPPASAHAVLTSSDPRKDSVVEMAPERVGLTFSEKVALSDDAVKVLDPKGARADDGKTVERGRHTYAVGLKPGLPDGTYTVTYQAVSADSHPISGAFTFSIGAPSKTTVAVGELEAGGGAVGALYDVARYVSYAGFILLTGGGAFVLACWQRGAGAVPLQRLVVGGWLALTGGTLLQLLLRGSYTTTGAFADVFDLSLMNDVLQTKTGAALVSRLLLLAAAALFVAVLFGAYVHRDTPEQAEERRDLTFGLSVGGVVVAAGIAATWAMSEHASAGIQTGIAMPVDIVHLLAVAAWLGGVAALLVCLRFVPELPAGAVRRFSTVAFGSVVVLVVTGLYQSWRQVGTWSALADTDYGRLLLVKGALVAVLVGIAFSSRRWSGRLAAGGGGTAEGAEHGTADGAEEAPKGSAETATDAGTDAGTESAEPAETVESEETVEPAEPTKPVGPPEPVEPSDHAESADPARAAQLARQRRAVADARARRRRDADPDRAALRRSALTEIVVAVALLAVATLLSSTEPARTVEEAARASDSGTVPGQPLSVTLPYDTGGENGRGKVQLDLDPGGTGGNRLHVYAKRPDGGPAEIPELKVSFTLAAKDIGPLRVTPKRIVAGHWTAEDVQLPAPGTWRVAVTVRTSDIDQITVYKNLKIG